jgi:hypothetical protein
MSQLSWFHFLFQERYATFNVAKKTSAKIMEAVIL